jgi:hypothetical protein
MLLGLSTAYELRDKPDQRDSRRSAGDILFHQLMISRFDGEIKAKRPS